MFVYNLRPWWVSVLSKDCKVLTNKFIYQSRKTRNSIAGKPEKQLRFRNWILQRQTGDRVLCHMSIGAGSENQHPAIFRKRKRDVTLTSSTSSPTYSSLGNHTVSTCKFTAECLPKDPFGFAMKSVPALSKEIMMTKPYIPSVMQRWDRSWSVHIGAGKGYLPE